MSIELYLSIAGIVIIVVTIVTGLEIRKISKEINEHSCNSLKAPIE